MAIPYRIKYQNKEVEAGHGENLRKALLKKGLSPYNGWAKRVNCHGLGTCGTCAVEVLQGKVNEPTAVEKWRLNFPPHQADSGLRLSCQLQVTSNLLLQKHPGFWGQKKP